MVSLLVLDSVSTNKVISKLLLELLKFHMLYLNKRTKLNQYVQMDK